MADDIQNVDDLMAFLRAKLRGGELNGSKRTGLLIKELQMVMVNSVLSGPKTPVRAIMGTSTATFLRPLSTAIGAALRYPLSGDASTLRASLAAVNGMIEAIPESFTLFRSKLNSYWKGDIRTIKTTFSRIYCC